MNLKCDPPVGTYHDPAIGMEYDPPVGMSVGREVRVEDKRSYS
ncbi:hypothetical protein [Bacillus atrophaeus]|nr:hypothetical protein [Bacillus atrophaeus]MEC0886929.1 hypothetical protein [Bacillus atrophaeus]